MKLLFFVLAIFTTVFAFGQHAEYSLGLHTGLLSYRGASAESSSFLIYDQVDKSGYTNNPYGRKPAAGYGLSLKSQHVGRGHMLFGGALEYEVLRSRIELTRVTVYGGFIAPTYEAEGRTILRSDFVNLHPFAGYRLGRRDWHLDLSAGLDVAACVNAREKARAIASNNYTFTSTSERKSLDWDFRPRLDLSLVHNRFGLSGSYSFGQSNYLQHYIGGNGECYSRVLRVGISYTFLR